MTDNSKSKVTLYRSNVNNEMFYNSATYNNTNLDESHKQGLELQNLFAVSPKWSTNVNYAYTNAIIDKEADNSAFNGKTNPMTSKHNISASVIYGLSDNASITLTKPILIVICFNSSSLISALLNLLHASKNLLVFDVTCFSFFIK